MQSKAGVDSEEPEVYNKKFGSAAIIIEGFYWRGDQ